MSHDERLTAVLAATGPVLLDFDGPVTPILAHGLNRQAADAMRARLAELGQPATGEAANTVDPLGVLRWADDHADRDALDEVEATFRRCEVDAAKRADETPGAAEFLTACRQAGRPVVVVSNNAAEAITAYLDHHGLSRYVRQIVGRAYARPALMKPHPAVVLSALTTVDAEPARCVLVGDSVTDIEVAHATGVSSIGYVKAPDRRAALEAAGPDATVDSMRALAAAVRAVPASVLPDSPLRTSRAALRAAAARPAGGAGAPSSAAGEQA